MLPLVANADTSANLITNGTFDNGTTGWTTSGDAQVIGDCCPGGHDFEFGNSGSIEQTFDLTSDDITTQMLDNGITLNSTVEVQNGEGGVGSWCPNCGDADSFRIDLTILDNNSQVLTTTTQTRTDVTGINGVDFTDSITYTGTGSYYGNIFIKGEDASTGRLGGPNVDNISVTMEYDPVVLSLEQTQHISAVAEVVEEIYIEEFVYEEPVIEEIIFEEPMVEIIEEPVFIEEEFIEETIVLAPAMIEPEIIEEVIEEPAIEEVFEEIVEAPIEEELVEEINETETIEETERDTEVNESNGDVIAEETEVDNESGSIETELTIEEISIKVADKIKTIDGQLKATQMIVAKVMQKHNKISSYSQVNTDIFIQPNIVDIDIGTYTNNTYVDIRNIYPNQTYEDRLWTSR
tara:strand:- start:11484 stop:12704 length:1221 start_codon:yes stop_codon:yes gene_type:complete